MRSFPDRSPDHAASGAGILLLLYLTTGRDIRKGTNEGICSLQPSRFTYDLRKPESVSFTVDRYRHIDPGRFSVIYHDPLPHRHVEKDFIIAEAALCQETYRLLSVFLGSRRKNDDFIFRGNRVYIFLRAWKQRIFPIQFIAIVPEQRSVQIKNPRLGKRG